MQRQRLFILVGVVLMVAFVFYLQLHKPGTEKNTKSGTEKNAISSAVSRVCMEASSNQVCSGKGRCFVGKCFCDDSSSGEFCEKSSRVAAKRASQCPDSVKNFETYANTGRDLFKYHRYDFCNYYQESNGIMRIDERRWSEAQKEEMGVWDGSSFSDDRNGQHAQWFNGYNSVKTFLDNSGKLGEVIEIGSGPFTQVNTLLGAVGVSTVKTVTLVDPLLAQYLQRTTHCTYKGGSLRGLPTVLVKAGAEQVDKYHEAYDTVIMMNVLEHCVDGWKVLENLYNMLRPGGLFIFNERWYDRKWDNYASTASGKPFWDAMHPINTKKAVIDHLLSNYHVLHRRDFSYEGDYPTDEGVYFVGIKKNPLKQGSEE